MRHPKLLVLATLALGLAGAHCSSSDSDAPSGAAGAGGSAGTGGTGGTAGMGGSAGADADAATDADAAPAPKAHLRAAHLSPDAPAVDICLRAHSTTATDPFTVGPVLKSLGVTAGLAYPQVTAYLDVDPGQYDVRIVAPDAADCTASLADLPDITDLPSLPADAYVTAAAIGKLGDSTFKLAPFIDDHSVASGKGKVRFVHASPGTPAVDVGLLADADAGGGFTTLFGNVSFGNASAGGSLSANGYLELAPVSGVTVSARPFDTTTDALVIPGVSVAAGDIDTFFAIGILGDDVKPLKVLACSDVDTSTAPLSKCAEVP